MKLQGGNIYLTKEDVLNIKQESLPLVVLSRNFFSRIATEISVFDHTVWNHFMWMIHPGKFLTQNWTLQEVPAEEYLQGGYQLKFWHSPEWTKLRREVLIASLGNEIAEPWYKHRYDILQIIGIKIGIRKLNIPWMRICSDWADFLKIADSNFNGNHSTPGEVDRWCADQPHYEVFGRFYPED